MVMENMYNFEITCIMQHRGNNIKNSKLPILVNPFIHDPMRGKGKRLGVADRSMASPTYNKNYEYKTK